MNERDRECENHICMITEKCINVGEKFIEFSVEARICFICMHTAQKYAFMHFIYAQPVELNGYVQPQN